jgi:hypothetical protein
VAGDQVAVLGRDEIGLDVVGAELDRQGVALERVVGQIAGGAAVADDEGLLGAAAVRIPAAGIRRARRNDETAGEHDEERYEDDSGSHGPTHQRLPGDLVGKRRVNQTALTIP